MSEKVLRKSKGKSIKFSQQHLSREIWVNRAAVTFYCYDGKIHEKDEGKTKL